jgi:hypothetical protein
LVSNKTGAQNTAAGANSLRQNVSGNLNIAVGTDAAYSNTTGSNSIAIGDSALFSNNSSYNVAIGSKALFSNSSGVSNTAVGSQTLTNNQTGSQNTAVGRTALFFNQTGIQNTALGNQALKLNDKGNGNTAVGNQSLFNNLINSNNTAVGSISLANTISDNNTGIGQAALNSNTLGKGNTAVGKDALVNNITGNYNTAIGYEAAIYGNDFVNATAVGANAQSGCSNCVVLGSTKGYNGATANSNVGIGTIQPQKTLHVNPDGAGGMMIGNNITTGGYTVMNMGISQASGGYSYIQSVKAAWPSATYGSLVLNQFGGNVGIRNAVPLTPLHIKQSNSDYPFKDGGLRTERHDNTNHWDIGIDEGNDLNFTYNGATKLYFNEVDGEITIVSDIRMKKDIQPIETALPSIMKLQAKSYHYKDNAAGSRLSYGFIAQDVEKIFPDFVTTKGPDNSKAVGYQKLNVMAIKAIQEQQMQIETLSKENIMIKSQLAKMQEAIEALQRK